MECCASQTTISDNTRQARSMMRPPILKSIVTLVSMIALHGCASLPADDPPKPVFLQKEGETSAADGSIFSNAGTSGLFSARGRLAIGDIVTVLIEENLSGTSSASSSANRASTTTALTPGQLARLGATGGFPFAQDLNPADSSIGSEGEGPAEQTGQISGSLTAVVTDVLPNGLLVLRGYKRLRLARGSGILRLQGLARTADVQPDNTLRSRRLADADISYVGRGDLDAAARAGWMNRALLNLWPF
jgi:flagellar L-ring protein precursor FlgH